MVYLFFINSIFLIEIKMPNDTIPMNISISFVTKNKISFTARG